MATERWARSRRVSSTNPGRLPGPIATNVRTPASSYSRSVNSRKRTGSSRCRTTNSRTSDGSSGNGAHVVADHTGRSPRRSGSRANAARTCPRYGSHIGVWNPDRNGSSCPSTPSGRSRSRTCAIWAGSPHTTDWCGQLSWLTTTPSRPCSAASALRAPQPSAAYTRSGTFSEPGRSESRKESAASGRYIPRPPSRPTRRDCARPTHRPTLRVPAVPARRTGPSRGRPAPVPSARRPGRAAAAPAPSGPRHRPAPERTPAPGRGTGTPSRRPAAPG